MTQRDSFISARLKALKKFLTTKKITALVIPILFGLSLQANAGILDDIGDIVDNVIDKVTSLFSSAVDLAEDLVKNIDTSLGDELAGLCSVVKASQEGGATSTIKAVEACGGDVVHDLEEAAKTTGGEIADQYKEIEDTLVEISKEQWAEHSGNFADLIRTITSYYTVIFENMKNTSEDLLDAMKDVKSTLESVDFPFGDIGPSTNIDLSYTIPVGTWKLEFFIRGTTTAVITDAGSNYVALEGKVVARIKYNSPTGFYQPGAYAAIAYSNPIIKFEKNKISGLLISQPKGNIALEVTAQPLYFTAGLHQLTSIPALKNLPILNVAAKAVSFTAEIGSMTVSVPITNQSGNDLDFDLSILASLEAKVKITEGWAVKVSERVTWKKRMTLDVPSLSISTQSAPAAVIDQIENGVYEEPSNAERILWLTFDDSNTSSVLEDHSNFGNDATKVGGVSLANGVATFNGTDGYIDLPDDLLKNLDDITVYAEVFIDENQQAPFWIYGLGNSNKELGDGYLFATGNYYRSSISTCHWICEQTTGISDENLPRGKWQTIAYTLKDNVATLYLNGDIINIKDDVTIKPRDIGGGATKSNFLGRSIYASDHYLKGAIRDFQIWQGAMTHREIIDNAKPKDDGPSKAQRILWLTFDDSNNSKVIADHSNYGHDATKVGGVTVSNGSATFNGTDGYIDLPDNLLKGVNDITVYAEVLIDEHQPSPFWIYGLGNSKNELGDGYLFATGDHYRNSLSTCHWICEQTTGEVGVNLPRKSWQTITYTLKDNVATLYLNGDVVSVKEDMTIKPSDIGGGNTTENYLGRSLYAADKYLKGSIRDFQIWQGALTHNEVIELSAPKPSNAERILWLTFDDSASAKTIKDHSNHGNNAQKKGGVKLKNGAAIFDGKDDYIDLPDNIMQGLDEITVFAEIKIDTDQALPFWIYGLGNSKETLGDGYLFATGNNYRNAISTCHWICEQSTGHPQQDLPRGSWQTIAYTLKGNTATLYLNGEVVRVKDDMTIKPSDIGNGKTKANFLGRSLYSSDNYLKGSIRDFQIWNRAMNHQEVANNTRN